MEKLLRNDDGNIMEKTFPHADEAIENAKEKGNAYWEMAKEKGKSLWKGSEFARRKTWGQTKGFIQKHPAQAVGYAALLGLILGVVFYPKGRE